MRRGEAIAVRFTPTREWAMRVPSESDTGMERGPKLLNTYGPSIPKLRRVGGPRLQAAKRNLFSRVEPDLCSGQRGHAYPGSDPQPVRR